MTNSKKEINEIQKRKIRDKAKAEAIRIKRIKEDKKLEKMIGDFLSRYASCEAVYKTIVKEYNRIKEKDVDVRNIKVNLTQGKPAFSLAGYDYDKNLIKRLFGAEENKNNKPAKIIRDKIIHSMDDSAIKELKNRNKQIFDDMDSFLNFIVNYDS